MTGVDVAPAYPDSWVTDVVLRDGHTVHVRPIMPTDAPALAEFHQRQSSESIYFRFLSARPQLSGKDLKHFTEIDYHDRMAFVAEIGDELIAVARYERYSGTDTAEVAFFVDDRHHGRGLATVMLEYLAAAAGTVGCAVSAPRRCPTTARC
ncbi:MAG: GNAT family N-acetyltransferase [Microthrixaceae bacterium]|nr:GNAT family N-acetyltransferase [Microthrixaceae bacterium]